MAKIKAYPKGIRVLFKGEPWTIVGRRRARHPPAGTRAAFDYELGDASGRVALADHEVLTPTSYRIHLACGLYVACDYTATLRRKASDGRDMPPIRASEVRKGDRVVAPPSSAPSRVVRVELT